MSSAKQVLVFGLLGKTESSEGAGATFSTSTDGILLAEPSVMTVDYVHDGARPFSPSSSGQRIKAAPSGRFGSFPVRVEGRGAGAAYSSTVLPPDINTLMRITGHSATVVTTSGSETVTYAPISTGYTSGAFDAYARGQKYPITAAHGDLSFTIDGPGFMVFESNVQGISALPSDVAVPSITYNTTIPPKAINIGLTIGSWSPVVRRVAFAKGLSIEPRANINAGGHAGFSPSRRSPTLEVVVEAAALATFDPYTAREAATSYAITFTVGSVQYNKIRFTAAQAQIANISEDEDGPSALWTLSFNLGVSGLAADDDYLLAFI